MQFINRTPQDSRKIDSKRGGLLGLVRRWIEGIEIRDPKVAQRVCELIPASCPFARDIRFFGRTLHIPPLCKLNPLYEQLMGLRFQALTFLAEKGEECMVGA